jgi:hypothetical protein
MPNKRLMGIFLRLSVVVGVIMTGVALGEMYVRYHTFANNHIKENFRIYHGLKCAQAFPDEVLLSHVNQHGNFDISKVGCSDKVFWARLDEVRNLPDRPPYSDVSLSSYLSPILRDSHRDYLHGCSGRAGDAPRSSAACRHLGHRCRTSVTAS